MSAGSSSSTSLSHAVPVAGSIARLGERANYLNPRGPG